MAWGQLGVAPSQHSLVPDTKTPVARTELLCELELLALLLKIRKAILLALSKKFVFPVAVCEGCFKIKKAELSWLKLERKRSETSEPTTRPRASWEKTKRKR